MPGAPTYKVLQEGDLLLAVNGTPVNTFAAVEAAVLREPRIRLMILRDGAEVRAARRMRTYEQILRRPDVPYEEGKEVGFCRARGRHDFKTRWNAPADRTRVR
jgi:hypothetical protein